MIHKRLGVNKSLDEKALKNIDPYSFLLFGMFTAISSPRPLIGSPRRKLVIHGSAWQFKLQQGVLSSCYYTLSEEWQFPIIVPGSSFEESVFLKAFAFPHPKQRFFPTWIKPLFWRRKSKYLEKRNSSDSGTDWTSIFL